MRKILLFLFCFVTLFSLLVFPVSAESNTTTFNLLENCTISHHGSSSAGWLPYEDRIVATDGPYQIRIQSHTNFNFEKITLNILYYSANFFDDVDLVLSGGSGFNGTLVGWDSVNKIAQYEFNVLTSRVFYFSLASSSYPCYFDIIGLTGELNNTFSFDRVYSYFYSYYTLNNEDVVKETLETGYLEFPDTVSDYRLSTSGFNSKSLVTAYFDITNSTSGSYDTFESIEFNFDSTDGACSIGVGLYTPGSDTPYEVIPYYDYVVESFDMDSYNIFNLTSYTVIINTDGIDLSETTINISVTYGYVAGEDSTYYNQFIAKSLIGELTTTKIPWYERFYNSVGNWFSSLGDKITNAIIGDPVESSPLEEPAIGFETAASDFNEAMDVIDSVTKPSISLDRDEAIPTLDPIVINTMGILTGDPTIIMMLGVVVTLCIISILLFGRRD